MNNKVIYIGILIVLLILILGMSEEGFVWVNPVTITRTYDKHCKVGRLPNCAAINLDKPQFCDVCIFDDGTGYDKQPFIPKYDNDDEKRGLGGCELNTKDPGEMKGIEPGGPYPTDLFGGECGRDNERLENDVGSSGQIGYPYLSKFPTTTGTARFTNIPNGGCLEGAYENNFMYAFGRCSGNIACNRNNYYKTRCVTPVSTIKRWVQEKRVINGMDMSEIDELPDDNNAVVHGKYFKAWRTGVHGC